MALAGPGCRHSAWEWLSASHAGLRSLELSTSLVTPALFTAYLRREVAQRGRFHMLSNIDPSEIPPDLVRLLVHVPAAYDQQHYYLYTVGPGLPEAKPNLPGCVPNERQLAACRVP